MISKGLKKLIKTKNSQPNRCNLAFSFDCLAELVKDCWFNTTRQSKKSACHRRLTYCFAGKLTFLCSCFCNWRSRQLAMYYKTFFNQIRLLLVSIALEMSVFIDIWINIILISYNYVNIISCSNLLKWIGLWQNKSAWQNKTLNILCRR